MAKTKLVGFRQGDAPDVKQLILTGSSLFVDVRSFHNVPGEQGLPSRPEGISKAPPEEFEIDIADFFKNLVVYYYNDEVTPHVWFKFDFHGNEFREVWRFTETSELLFPSAQRKTGGIIRTFESDPIGVDSNNNIYGRELRVIQGETSGIIYDRVTPNFTVPPQSNQGEVETILYKLSDDQPTREWEVTLLDILDAVSNIPPFDLNNPTPWEDLGLFVYVVPAVDGIQGVIQGSAGGGNGIDDIRTRRLNIFFHIDSEGSITARLTAVTIRYVGIRGQEPDPFPEGINSDESFIISRFEGTWLKDYFNIGSFTANLNISVTETANVEDNAAAIRPIDSSVSLPDGNSALNTNSAERTGVYDFFLDKVTPSWLQTLIDEYPYHEGSTNNRDLVIEWLDNVGNYAVTMVINELVVIPNEPSPEDLHYETLLFDHTGKILGLIVASPIRDSWYGFLEGYPDGRQKTTPLFQDRTKVGSVFGGVTFVAVSPPLTVDGAPTSAADSGHSFIPDILVLGVNPPNDN